jgi:DNA-binding MarR family transcriptional regulator
VTGTQRCLAVHALEVNLSFLECYVLACLSEHPDYTLRMSQLAAVASSELSRLPHLMRRLETRGLVRRVPDPADGPFTLALPTEAGHELAIKAAPHTRGARAARGVRHRLGSEAALPTSTRRAINTTPIGHTDPARAGGSALMYPAPPLASPPDANQLRRSDRLWGLIHECELAA